MLAVYLAAMLVWSWPHDSWCRFSLCGCLFAFRMGSVLARIWQDCSARQILGAVAVSAMVVANGGVLAYHGMQVQRTQYPMSLIGNEPVNWSAYQRTFVWLEQHSQPDDVLASGVDSMVARYTDRRAFRPFVYDPGRLFYSGGDARFAAPEELAAILQNRRPATWCSLQPGSRRKPLAMALQELRRCYPLWLTIAYQDADPRFVVFAFDAAHEPDLSQRPAQPMNLARQ
jgi:hypothetical protein